MTETDSEVSTLSRVEWRREREEMDLDPDEDPPDEVDS